MAKVAAIRLQKSVQREKKFVEVKSAAIKLQSVWRGYSARCRHKLSIQILRRWESSALARDQGTLPSLTLPGARNHAGRRPAPQLRSLTTPHVVHALHELTQSEPSLRMPIALSSKHRAANRLVPMSSSTPSLETFDMLVRMGRLSDPNNVSRPTKYSCTVHVMFCTISYCCAPSQAETPQELVYVYTVYIGIRNTGLQNAVVLHV